jgi:3-deoxy-D-manno-octulosonate 8-phosphate phosphatase (KDO 8-P phosphatase)
MPLSAEDLRVRAARVRLLLLDVDGVLTDGTVEIDSTGRESKRYFIRDGLSLVWARREGIDVGLLSGRASGSTTRRAAELGIHIVVQGNTNKLQGYEDILTTHGLADEDVAYMGDDLLDLPVMRRVGLATAPADSTEDVLRRAHWVSRHPGGRGAVRELVELLLDARGRWRPLVETYLT